jgi:hypothetical protein
MDGIRIIFCREYHSPATVKAMKTSTPSHNYQDFRLINSQQLIDRAQLDSSTKPLAKYVQQLSKWLWQQLWVNSDLQVWQSPETTRDELRWNAYDPQNRQGLYNVSEENLRAWIEQRHHIFEHYYR